MTQTEEKITFEQMPQLLAELKGAIIVRITISPPICLQSVARLYCKLSLHLL